MVSCVGIVDNCDNCVFRSYFRFVVSYYFLPKLSLITATLIDENSGSSACEGRVEATHNGEEDTRKLAIVILPFFPFFFFN